MRKDTLPHKAVRCVKPYISRCHFLQWVVDARGGKNFNLLKHACLLLLSNCVLLSFHFFAFATVVAHALQKTSDIILSAMAFRPLTSGFDYYRSQSEAEVGLPRLPGFRVGLGWVLGGFQWVWVALGGFCVSSNTKN